MTVNPAHHTPGAEQTEPHRGRLVQPERTVQRHHGQVHRQEQAAAEVAERPPARRHGVALVRQRDVAQDRVVHDQAGDRDTGSRRTPAQPRAASPCRSRTPSPSPPALPAHPRPHIRHFLCQVRSANAPTTGSTQRAHDGGHGRRRRRSSEPGEIAQSQHGRCPRAGCAVGSHPAARCALGHRDEVRREQDGAHRGHVRRSAPSRRSTRRATRPPAPLVGLDGHRSTTRDTAANATGEVSLLRAREAAEHRRSDGRPH